MVSSPHFFLLDSAWWGREKGVTKESRGGGGDGVIESRGNKEVQRPGGGVMRVRNRG